MSEKNIVRPIDGVRTTGYMILNWPEIKNPLQKEIAPSGMAVPTRRTENLYTHILQHEGGYVKWQGSLCHQAGIRTGSARFAVTLTQKIKRG